MFGAVDMGGSGRATGPPRHMALSSSLRVLWVSAHWSWSGRRETPCMVRMLLLTRLGLCRDSAQASSRRQRVTRWPTRWPQPLRWQQLFGRRSTLRCWQLLRSGGTTHWMDRDGASSFGRPVLPFRPARGASTWCRQSLRWSPYTTLGEGVERRRAAPGDTRSRSARGASNRSRERVSGLRVGSGHHVSRFTSGWAAGNRCSRRHLVFGWGVSTAGESSARSETVASNQVVVFGPLPR